MTLKDMMLAGITIEGAVEINKYNEDKDDYETLFFHENRFGELWDKRIPKNLLNAEIDYMFCEKNHYDTRLIIGVVIE